MSELIDELKRDHVAIENMLTRAKDANISHKEAHTILIAAKVSLIAHLKKEDAKLYPVLNNAAQENAGLKRTMDFYAKDMVEITRNAIAFFDKYSSPDAANDIEFAKAFGELFSTISIRLRDEEKTLYKEYEKIKP